MAEKVKQVVAVAADNTFSTPAQLEDSDVGRILMDVEFADTKLIDLPVPDYLADSTKAATVRELVKCVVDENGLPVEFVYNIQPTQAGVNNNSDIAVRMQAVSAFLDLITRRYRIVTPTYHEVDFDHSLAMAKGVAMKVYGGKWVRYDWFAHMGGLTKREKAPAQIACDKHNIISVYLSGQQVVTPFGRDTGLFKLLQDCMELTLKAFLLDREARFAKLREMNNAFWAAKNPLVQSKYNVKFTAEPPSENGVYRLFKNGVEQGERTYRGTPDQKATFVLNAQAGYTWTKIADLPE